MNDQLYTNDELNGIESLPPAGDARRDELAQRTDALAQQIEEQSADRGAIPHDHDALRPDRNREIQFAISENYLEIGKDHPIYVTKWVNYKNQDGHMVWQEKARGWVIATIHEFPEATSLQKEDGSIRVGDVILMFITKDKHFLLEEKAKERRLRQQFGIEAEIHDLAHKKPNVFAGVSTPAMGVTGRLGKAAQTVVDNMDSRAAAVNQAARRTAAHHIGERMKTGTIPGVPIK